MLHSALSMSLIASTLFLTGAVVHADEPKPQPKSDAKAEPTVSEPRTQTLKGFTYFYGSTRTTFTTLVDHIQKLIPAVAKGVHDAHAEPAGPMILIYKGATDANSEFELQIGYPIAKSVEAVGEFKVREVADYPCTAVIYTGPMSKVSSAYEKLMPAAMAGADKPTDEMREMILYFEAPESPNNIAHISVGRKEGK